MYEEFIIKTKDGRILITLDNLMEQYIYFYRRPENGINTVYHLIILDEGKEFDGKIFGVKPEKKLASEW